MKKNKLIIFFFLLFVFFLIVFIFSMWLFEKNDYFVNNLEISYNEENKIKSTYELYPMSDVDGIKTSPYIFKIINNEDVNTKYSLIIKDLKDNHDSDQLLDRSQINYQLKRNNEVVSFGNLGDIKNNVLVIDNILKSDTNVYELRIWLSSDSMDTNWMGKYYNYNISIKPIEK